MGVMKMKREQLESYLGQRVTIQLFDDTVDTGYLQKTGDIRFQQDLNLFLPKNQYFLTSNKETKQTISPIFRCSHVKKLT